MRRHTCRRAVRGLRFEGVRRCCAAARQRRDRSAGSGVLPVLRPHRQRHRQAGAHHGGGEGYRHPLFIEAGSGYTVYEAEGGFAKEDGTVVQNDTLVFDSTHGDEQAILDLIEKVRRALNVESVYCESKLVGCQIRGGVISGVS
ncbi:MAG: hypothetical protein ACLTMP_10080 [Eggerthella lenta]